MKSIRRLFLFVMLLALAWSQASAQQQDGLVAHWSFDAMKGDTILDESGNGYHGTNYGAELVDGIIGKALSFNGKQDYARIPGDGEEPPQALSRLGKGTISLWFKADFIPTDYGIAPILYYGAEEQCDFFDAANKGLIIELGHSPVHMASENLYFTIWKNGCTYPSFCYDSNRPIPVNQWQHLVVVVGEDYNTGYLNGEEMKDRRYNFGNASYSQFFADAMAHEKLWLGKGYWDRTTQYFGGEIDDIRIYSSPLDSSEIQELYDMGSDGLATNVSSSENKNPMIYPIPASDYLVYEKEGMSKEVEVLRVLDVSGRVVKQDKVTRDRGRLDVSGLPGGYYYVEFYGKGARFGQKILVHNSENQPLP